MTKAQQTSKAAQSLSLAIAVAFVLIAMAAGYRAIGLPPVVIVGGLVSLRSYFDVRFLLTSPSARFRPLTRCSRR